MKKLLAFVFMSGCLLSVYATEVASQQDSVITISNAKMVTVVTNDQGATMVNVTRNDMTDYQIATTVKPCVADTTSDWNLDLPFLRDSKSKKRSRWEVLGMKNIYVGATIPGKESVGIGGGWELGLPLVVGVGWRPTCGGAMITLGVGCAYKSMSLSGPYAFGCNQGTLQILPCDDRDYSGSIQSKSWTMPLMYRQNVYKELVVTLGGIASLNTYTTASQRYIAPDGVEYELRYKGLHQRPLTVDIMTAIGVEDCLGVYVKYSPMGAFRNGFGPQYRSISIGAVINL